MRLSRLAFLTCAVLVWTTTVFGQAASGSDPQAIALLQRSIGALTGGLPVTDVTMTGALVVTNSAANPGSGATGQPTTQSSTVTLVATASGQSQNTAVTPSGTQTTVQDISGTVPTLTVTGTDGVSHTIQTASALTPHPAWFYPAFVLASGLSSSYAASYVGHETRNGIAVEHIAIWRTNGSTTAVSPVLQLASQHDIYLDSASLLPVAMTFIAHPYDPSNPNKPFIPYRGNTPDRLAEIQFSNYQQVQGRPVALHMFVFSTSESC